MSTHHHPVVADAAHDTAHPHAVWGGPALGVRVRATLVRRDRLRLADAVAALIDRAGGLPAPTAGLGPVLAEQLMLARPVLIEIEHLLRGDGPLDPRGVQRIGTLLADVRRGALAPCDLLALDDDAREARRLLRAGAAR
jgi:hypothetical protein